MSKGIQERGRARVLTAAVGRGWRANHLRVNGRWIVDTRRACEHCARSYRDCACDIAVTRATREGYQLDREVA